jgi:hypothetical protein
MKFIAAIFGAVFFIAIAVGGYFANILMTPVTPGNVESRLTSICRIGLNAYKLDQRDRIRNQRLGSLNCSCVANKIIEDNGPTFAARTANMFRRILMAALGQMVTGVRADERTLAEAGVSQSDMRHFSRILERIGKQCDVAAESLVRKES